MKIISKFKTKDALGKDTTVVIVKEPLNKMDFYKVLESKFPNKDFYLDEINHHLDGDKMYSIRFAGNIKL